MIAHRIKITSWTASFRYPNLISGVQPSLEVPPLSTVLGLLNAAAGQYLEHKNLEIGYYFEFGAKTFDLETIYQIDSDSKNKASNNAKSNIIQREFLFENTLWLYFTDIQLVQYFKQPAYSLLLGRSGDLASVEVIDSVELIEVTNASKIKGQIIPLEGNFIAGQLQALPRYFSNTFPRKNLGTEAFSIISHLAPERKTQITAFRDEQIGGNGVDIFFHKFSLSDYA
ncbi:MAG: type I-B CRISPR-associated protein Cas5 [Saprospiraceae bacterium]|jgi:CRISPR-associated protein Cas5t|nr:type I-B CRISPR-associated protein Cas5 [Saprospiraceae bacterium]